MANLANTEERTPATHWANLDVEFTDASGEKVLKRIGGIPLDMSNNIHKALIDNPEHSFNMQLTINEVGATNTANAILKLA